MKPATLMALLPALCLLLGSKLSSPILAADRERLTIDVRDTRADIHAQLLKRTPLGSSPGEVKKFLKTQVLKKGDPEPKLSNHGATGPSAEASSNKGVKCIKLQLGDYLASPILLTLPTPLVLNESLTAQWAFDRDGKLIEIFIDRAVKN